MKSSILLAAAFTAMVSAAPAPQMDADDLDALLAALPEPTQIDVLAPSASVDLAAVAASVIATQVPVAVAIQETAEQQAAAGIQKRQNQLTGLTYQGANTPEAFKAYQPFKDVATNAATPSGYDAVYFGDNSFSSKQPGILAVNTLSSYDPAACAAKCNKNQNCQSFAMWYERDPDPSTSADSLDSVYTVKCLSYSYSLGLQYATNPGQWRGGYYVTQNSVRGYQKSNGSCPDLPGYTVQNLMGATIVTNSSDVINGVNPNVINGSPSNTAFDPSIGATRCAQVTNKGQFESGLDYRRNCNFFNAFTLLKNQNPIGWQYQTYTRPFGADHAKQVVQYNSAGDAFTHGVSCGYTLIQQVPEVTYKQQQL